MTGKRGTIAERLDRHLDKSGECWIWTGYTRAGYGRIGDHDGKMLSAHRVAWELANGPIPDGMNILHSCDNPPCCRPVHLHPGTQLDNVREMDARGRGRRVGRGYGQQGERNTSAKLDRAQVREIRKRYAAGGISQRALSKQYGVTQTNIGYIVRFDTWAHIS